MIAVIPNELSNAINKKLDAAFEDFPEAEKDRDGLFRQLLYYFDEHGILPDFKLVKKSDNNNIQPTGKPGG